jgi:hypothetical protein
MRGCALLYPPKWQRSDLSVVMNSFYVYVVQEVKASATAPIKIGVSNDIERRVACLQTCNPRKLELKASFGPMRKLDAYDLERHMHGELARYWLRGEWYSGKALKQIFSPKT